MKCCPSAFFLRSELSKLCRQLLVGLDEVQQGQAQEAEDHGFSEAHGQGVETPGREEGPVVEEKGDLRAYNQGVAVPRNVQGYRGVRAGRPGPYGMPLRSGDVGDGFPVPRNVRARRGVRAGRPGPYGMPLCQDFLAFGACFFFFFRVFYI